MSHTAIAPLTPRVSKRTPSSALTRRPMHTAIAPLTPRVSVGPPSSTQRSDAQ